MLNFRVNEGLEWWWIHNERLSMERISSEFHEQAKIPNKQKCATLEHSL